MTTRLIEYELSDGSIIAIEASAPLSGATRRSAEVGATRARETFESALQGVSRVAQDALQVFRRIEQPSDITIEFGVKFSADAGIFIASLSSETVFKVSIKWTGDS